LRWLPIALVVIEGLLFFAALLFISYWRNSDLSAPDPLTLLWTAFLSSALTIIVTFQYVTGYILAQREEKRLKNDRTVMEWLGLGPSRNTPLWVILLGAMALAVILDTLGLVLGVTETSLPIPLMGINEAVDPFAFFVAALVLVILRPIADELIFRGVLLPALLPLMRPFYAVLASAGLYGLLHFALDPQFVWWGLVLPCVVGLLAGVARLTTQSTQTAIGVSAMFGLWAVLRAIVA
jgi:membrane protease YdiL (CAAX protease family)